ncbi:MAG TPA: hypothetical protein VG253_25840, partial [Streptosporangiaceae bacterium]|nr:hypothetical protein [Streptosporangiaceae bacterium]
PAIEWSGDAMFARRGIRFPPGPATVKAAIDHGAEILVAGDPPIAFAAVTTLDGHPHLEQISVRADQGTQRRRKPPAKSLLIKDVPG